MGVLGGIWKAVKAFFARSKIAAQAGEGGTISELTFSDKREQWLEILSGKDRHSIIRQLTQMTWDAAAFRVVNEARRLAPPAPDGGVQVNGLVHSLLDRGFFISQMVAIRRLMDTYEIEGKRGVHSLTGLLDDMRAHRELFTREAVFAAEGLEYDYEPVRQKSREYDDEKLQAGERSWFTPPKLHWRRHENRHKDIDRLAGVNPENRQPGDTIRESVFDNLESRTKSAFEDMKTYVDKFIAHAATPASRELVQADKVKITLNHLWEAHQHLCEVASFVRICVLGDACSNLLPIPQYDQFKYIDRPLIEPPRVTELRKFWDKFEDECRGWRQWGLDAYEQEFP